MADLIGPLSVRCADCDAPFTGRDGEAGTRTKAHGKRPGANVCYVCAYQRRHGHRGNFERSVLLGHDDRTGRFWALVGEVPGPEFEASSTVLANLMRWGERR